jgi:UDP-glucose 4-epimerase
MQEKILLTGASGYAGGVIAGYLRKANIQFLTAGRQATDNLYFDLMQPEKFQEQCFPTGIETCIHVAAIHEVHCKNNCIAAYNANVVATRALIDSAVKAGVKHFIYVSTFHVFGNPSGNLSELAIPSPSNDYGLSHLLAEEMFQFAARQYNVQVTILRPSNLFGVPDDWSTFNRWTLAPFDFVKQALENHQIVLYSDGSPVRNYVSLSFWQNAVINAVTGQLPQITHVAGQTWSIYELAFLVATIVENEIGLSIPVIRGSEKSLEHPYHFFSEHWNIEVNDDNKKEMYGFITNTIKYYLDNLDFLSKSIV